MKITTRCILALLLPVTLTGAATDVNNEIVERAVEAVAVNDTSKVIDLDGYKAYWMEKHIYLIEPGLSDKGISALFDKFETEGSFNPGNVVVFGYSFSWTQLEALKNNLLKIAANGTNKHVLLDKRY
ncbi:MAG: hypothetical protein IKD75_10575 [Prevotella sp.]|nr:hypothetical protein [Prevotella sp.]